MLVVAVALLVALVVVATIVGPHLAQAAQSAAHRGIVAFIHPLDPCPGAGSGSC